MSFCEQGNPASRATILAGMPCILMKTYLGTGIMVSSPSVLWTVRIKA